MASQDSEMAATQIEMMAKRAEEGDLGRIKLDDQRMDECQLGGINIFYFLFCINKIRRKIITLISTFFNGPTPASVWFIFHPKLR